MENLLNVLRKDRPVAVFVHNNPDPDALASAFGLRILLKKLGFTRVRGIYFSGLIGRAENREMIRLLKIHLTPTEKARRYEKWQTVLVDCQPYTGNLTLPEGLKPTAVIDHHPLRKKTTRLPFYDVRPQYGACSTIIAEYFQAAGVPVPGDAATGFCYGISSETRRLARDGSAADRTAYLHLLSLASFKRLSQIEYSRLSREFIDHLSKVLLKAFYCKNFACALLDDIPYPDFPAEMADFLLRIRGISWSLCLGQHGDTLYVSIRSTNPRAEASSLIRRILPRQGKSGGHGMVAGGQVRIDCADPARLMGLKRSILDKMLDAIRCRGVKLTRFAGGDDTDSYIR